MLGAGAVLPLPDDTCPVGRDGARSPAGWAPESAGQCGPCVLGLPALAEHSTAPLTGWRAAPSKPCRRGCGAVEKRGACSHPDGTARFVASALGAFPEEFERPCARAFGCGRPVTGALPVTGSRPLPSTVPTPPTAPPKSAAPPQERLLVDWTLCQGHGLCADVVPDIIELGSTAIRQKRQHAAAGPDAAPCAARGAPLPGARAAGAGRQLRCRAGFLPAEKILRLRSNVLAPRSTYSPGDGTPPGPRAATAPGPPSQPPPQQATESPPDRGDIMITRRRAGLAAAAVATWR